MKFLSLSGAIALATLAVPAQAQVKNGVAPQAPSAASVQMIDFDPPCVFAEGIPLQLAPYMNPATNTTFVLGNGVVLTGCGGFGVTGISPPNFMAWNCAATNGDGTAPALPEVWFFGSQVTTVSVRVGSTSNAGSSAVLAALGPFPTFTLLSIDVVTLTADLQTLSTTAPGTAAAALFGPCVMVADDFAAQ